MKIAGKSLGEKPWEVGNPGKWKGDYLGGLPGLNKWVKDNRKLVDGYDGGALSAELKDLKLIFDGVYHYCTVYLHMYTYTALPISIVLPTTYYLLPT